MADVNTPETLKCLRCGHKWIPRKPVVRICPHPKCHSPYWNVPRKEKNNGTDNTEG